MTDDADDRILEARARARLRELFPEVFVDGRLNVDRLRARVGEPTRDDATTGAACPRRRSRLRRS